MLVCVGEAFLHLRHVFDEHHRPVHRSDRQIVQRRNLARRTIRLHHELPVADPRRSRRQNQVLLRDRRRNIRSRKMLGVQQVRVRVHHDLPHLAAVRQRHRRSLHVRQARPDKADPQVVQVGLAQPFARKRKLHDRNRRSVELDDVGRVRPRRQHPQNRLHHRRNLRKRQFNLHIRLKVHPDHRHALVRLRLRVFNIVHRRRQRPLADRDDPPLHLRRRQPRIRPHDRHDRDVDVRENVLRRFNRRADSKQKDQQREDHKRIRAPQRELNNPHAVPLKRVVQGIPESPFVRWVVTGPNTEVRT